MTDGPILPPEDELTRALRALPPLEGGDDWEALASRLAARLPARPHRRISRRLVLSGSTVAGLAALSLAVLLPSDARRSETPVASAEGWLSVHRQAVQDTTWLDDPWVAAAEGIAP